MAGTVKFAPSYTSLDADGKFACTNRAYHAFLSGYVPIVSLERTLVAAVLG
jgi:hypothetical protein